jgi:hypothetical protein
MKRITFRVAITLLAAPACLLAQTASPSPNSSQSFSTSAGQVPVPSVVRAARFSPPEPFSRLALEGGLGIGGINMQAAVEANRYLNVRGIGNYFSYSVNNMNISSGVLNGVEVSGKIDFAEAGVAVDVYPFPNHGFRLSPGVTFFNQNGASARGAVAADSSITLGSTQYYSDTDDPMAINANLGLNAHKQAFTMTTGWGNMISRRGGHLSFPFEFGAIFTGAPTVGLNITGKGCTNAADASDDGPSCVDMNTNATALANVNAQIATYRSDVNQVKIYPILSFGVAYNFHIH